MSKPIGYYSTTPTAKAIESEFGCYLQQFTATELRTAIAFSAANSDEVQSLIASKSEGVNWQLIEILNEATESDRLALLPFFVDVLRSR